MEQTEAQTTNPLHKRPAANVRAASLPPAAPEPIAVRMPDAVRMSGFSRTDLYRRAARGEIIFRKAGKIVLVDVASLKAAVAALPLAKIKVAA